MKRLAEVLMSRRAERGGGLTSEAPRAERAETLFSAVRSASFGLLYVLAFKHWEKAGCPVVLFLLLFEGGLVVGAVVLGTRAAGVERATLGRVRRRRHVSGEDHALALALLLRVGHGDGREQRGGVGVARHAVESRPVGDLFDHGEVVGYEDVGEVEFLLQVLQKVDDLRLDRDVQSRDWLVADDQARVESDGPCHPDPLPLSARKLVGVAIVVLGVQADHLEKLLHPPLALAGATAHVVDPERLGDDVAYGHAGVQARIRVLEDDLHVPPHAEHPLAVVTQYVLAVEDHLALRRFQKAQHEAVKRTLSAPRLPHEPERLPAAHREVDAIHSLHVPDRTLQHAGLYGEVHLQIPGLQQILAGMTVGLRATARSLDHVSTPSSSSTRLLFSSISSTERMHAAVWSGFFSSRPGSISWHSSFTKGQRGLKLHPSGRKIRLGGVPSIGRSLTSPAVSRRGSERNSDHE